MIYVPVRFKTVFEITETEVKFPERMKRTAFQKTEEVYFAPSTSIIVADQGKLSQIFVGREVTPETIKNTFSFAVTGRRKLQIAQCEVLSNLQDIDRMVVSCNEFIDTIPELVLTENCIETPNPIPVIC